MRQPAPPRRNGAPLGSGDDVLDAPEGTLAAHEEDAVVDVEPAEILEILRKRKDGLASAYMIISGPMCPNSR